MNARQLDDTALILDPAWQEGFDFDVFVYAWDAFEASRT